MRTLKAKFIPLFVVLAVVFCGTWALAANGVFEASAADGSEYVSTVSTAVQEDEGYTNNSKYTTALALQQAMTQLTDATEKLENISQAAANTIAYDWMCAGETVGQSLEIIQSLIDSYDDVPARVAPCLALLDFYDRTPESPVYTAYTLALTDAQAATEHLKGIYAEIQSLFSGYDLDTCSVSYAGSFKLTGYCGCAECCGIYSNPDEAPRTASGTMATQGRTIAMSSEYPFGTVVYIDGLGFRTVEDRGGAVQGNKIDVYMDNHEDCFSRSCNRTAATYIVDFIK